MQFRTFFEMFAMNKFLKFFAVPVALSLLLLQSVQAVVPADVTTALSDMWADGVMVAGLVLVALVLISAIKQIRRAVGLREDEQWHRDREGFYDFDDNPFKR